MGIITRMRKQTAVYWGLASDESGVLAIDDYGQPKITTPVEILVRWDDERMEFLDAKGDKQISRSKVYTGIDVSIGGLLMLGEIVDIVGSSSDIHNLKENNNTWEIRGFEKNPNLRATEFLRTAIL